MTATQSDPPSLTEVRAGALRQPGLLGEDLRTFLADGYDSWLRMRFGQLRPPGETGVALVAVGGLGRRQLAPYSDLDLLLLHDGKVDGLAELADQIWYPIWDSGLGLDHSVRTPDQAFGIARDDLKALLGLIELRHIAGDVALSGPLRERLRDSWRASAPKRADDLHELAAGRWQLAGEAAFLLEPNLKDSRGGLRDVQTLHALAVAQLADFAEPVRAAQVTLLDIRGELHRRTEHDEDVLRQQEQSGVAGALGLADGDSLLRAVNEAARTISLALDTVWRRVELTPRGGWAGTARRLLRGPLRAPAQDRQPLASGVVSQEGEVVLAREADPWADPVLLLRAARAAAVADLPLAPFTLERLATESAPLPQPWPAPALREFVSLLGTGRAAVPVMEALDQSGLLVGLIPEWDLVRFKAQHNPVHRFTVDRHLTETAARAAALTRSVGRPDLLLLGALLHDIGKGVIGGDHSETGAALAERIGTRMGLSYGDAATVTALVRHHLLLPNTATRRDLEDPMTVSAVAEAVTGSVELLELLHALTIADALATGPMVWSEWKAGLIQDLVRRTRFVLGGAQPPPAAPLDEHRRRLAEAGALAVEVSGVEVVVAAPDSVGVLSRAAGVLALHSLDVRSASIHTHAGMAVNSFVVEPRFGELPDPVIVRNDLARALDGSLELREKLSAKERAYARIDPGDGSPPSVLWFDDAATDATVLEYRADDSIGLLYRITATLERCGLDIRQALVSSLGGAVVDAFYVTTLAGEPIPTDDRDIIESRLIGA